LIHNSPAIHPYVIVFIAYLKPQPSGQAGEKIPHAVEFPYVPGENTEPETGTLLQVTLFIEVLWIGTLIATSTVEHRRKINLRWRQQFNTTKNKSSLHMIIKNLCATAFGNNRRS